MGHIFSKYFISLIVAWCFSSRIDQNGFPLKTGLLQLLEPVLPGEALLYSTRGGVEDEESRDIAVRGSPWHGLYFTEDEGARVANFRTTDLTLSPVGDLGVEIS